MRRMSLTLKLSIETVVAAPAALAGLPSADEAAWLGRS